ncbi:MAG: response regulator [Deltaproteobacteria bacterium]|nr:response regulator [Deltaproteobacteria bacterium]
MNDITPQKLTLEQFQAMELEIRRLRRENKKINRQYVFLQKLMQRTKETTANNMNLSMVLDAERSSREVFLDLILQNSPNVILVFDGSNRLLYGTTFFLKLLGLPHMGLLTGRTPLEIFSQLLSEADMAMLDDNFTMAVNTKTPAMHTQVIRFNPQEKSRNFVIQITPLIDPDINIAGTLMLFHDQTEEIEARQAAASSEAKTTFMANMSHEIRTPLNTIMALSKAELQKSLSERTRTSLTKIHSAGGTLLSIINDLLDISKAEAGHFQIQANPYEFADLISDSISINIVRIESKPIEFTLTIDESIPSIFMGDELRVKQIINNLLSNAFKYTDSGHVNLEVAFVSQDHQSGFLHFNVSDTGRGIKPEFINEIFAPYSQAELHAAKIIEGTGLGLTICRELVKMMNGEISVESVYGQGSTFKVFIEQIVHDSSPLGPEVVESLKNFQFLSRSSMEQQIINRFYLPMARVLVVDDVETNLDVALALLQPYGLVVDCVSSGQQAINLVKNAPNRYDCIFMDHMMPEMDGIEAVRKIRNEIDHEYAKNVPIVAMTANALVGNEQLFLKSGFQAFISKPIDLNKLDLILNRFIKDRYPEHSQTTSAPLENTPEATAESIKSDPASEPANPGSAPNTDRQIGEDVIEGEESQDDEEAKEKAIFDRLNSYYIEGLDLVKGLARYENKSAVYVPLLRSFIRHAPLMLEDLKNPSVENLANYAIRVHGFKGASAGICADKLAALALELELTAKKSDLAGVQANNDEFIAAAETLLRELNFMLRDIPMGQNEERRPMRLKPSHGDLTALLRACQSFKNNDIQKYLKKLESYTFEYDGDLVPWLREQIDNIEYDLVYERLTQYLAEPAATADQGPNHNIPSL